MKFYALTDIGKRREINEDSYILPSNGKQYCAVADGMGGHNAGEVASAIAVETFSKKMSSHSPLTEDKIREAVEAANRKVFEYAMKDRGCKGMGTTLTGFAADGNHVFVAHVGDSSCYLVRNGKIKKITHDHSWVQEMVDNGQITPLEAKNSPRRNWITRAVGTHETVEVDVFHVKAQPDDVFLLCSDGLTNHVTEKEAAEITCDNSKTWKEKLKQLIDLALEDGGTDNITAVYAVYAEDNK